MSIRVTHPSGATIEFPDGTDEATIGRAMSQFDAESQPQLPDFAAGQRRAMQEAQPVAATSAKPMAWSDVPGEAVSNLGSSAVNFGRAVVEPILHPIQTAQNIGSLAEGAFSKFGAYLPGTRLAYEAYDAFRDPEKRAVAEASADAVGQFYSDRYGGVEQIKNTLATDPVGVAADAAVLLTGGGAAAARAPGVVGQVGQVVSRAGRAIDPLQAAGRVVASAGRGASHVLGTTAGTGAEPIQTAFNAGYRGNQAFPQHMRGQAPIDDVVDMADRGVNALKRQRSDAYEAGMGAVKVSTTQISYVPIRQTLSKAFQDITYSGRAKNQGALKVIQDMAEEVKGFENLPNNAGRTAAGLDALKQAISGIWEKTPPNTTERRVASQIYNAIKAEITKQVPEYADTMRGYSEASDQIKELQRTFSLSEKAATDTTIRKLQSTMRNNVNTNYGQRRKLLDELAQYEPDLPPALAGQALSSWTPRGLQGLGATATGFGGITHMNPYAVASLPAFSPRVVGEAAYGAGRVAGAAGRAAGRVGPRNIQSAILAAYAAGSMTPAKEKIILEMLKNDGKRDRGD